MREFALSVCFGVFALVAADQASAQQGEDCFPLCRDGYVCYGGECVSACNPPCPAGQVCDEQGQCVVAPGTVAPTVIPPTVVPASVPATASVQYAPTNLPPAREAGDERFRLAFLGRFGFGGKIKSRFIPTDSFDPIVDLPEVNAEVTLGYILRFEKPPTKYVSFGLDLSNYWIQAEGAPARDLLADISVLVKPRFPFVVGKKHRELEAYIHTLFGGTLAVFNSENFYPWSTFGWGFNVGVGPGFQAFVASRTVVILETGYAFTWVQTGASEGDGAYGLRLGQGLLRVGIAGAF